MRKLLSLTRRCVEDYQMIEAGDDIAVGLSGGKDSLALLASLAALRRFFPQPFTLRALTVDMGIPGMDFSPLQAYCDALEVPFTRIPSQIHHVIFEQRQEKNPCALCANMRRGVLHEHLQQIGCHKIALGHHYDDAVETFLLSLFYEGRFSCFRPVTYLDRSEVTQIRPLLYCGEELLQRFAEREALPVLHNPCPANGGTKRQEVKELIVTLRAQYPKLKEHIFRAMQRLPLAGWEAQEGTHR